MKVSYPMQNGNTEQTIYLICQKNSFRDFQKG